MSSDNGIYIARFENEKSSTGYEYRVAECAAIDNATDLTDLIVSKAYCCALFEDAPVFRHIEKARSYARWIAKDYPSFGLEYGVVEISFDFPFPNWDKDVVNLILAFGA